ncbi:MAG: hypothetical protein H0X17_03680 [Deltaproteobacteria bacterium]|nr:hypothetical protein [Deltaproteobacteria bacterium]
MASIRHVAACLACCLALPLVACGGGDDGASEPEGPHYTYVASQVLVPATNSQAREYGLDLNGDGTVDNQLGMVLSTLGSQGFDIQTTIDEAVAQGSIILLADFQTSSFESTAGAGLQIKLGDKATSMPAPCTNPADPLTCGKHLTGTGVFTVAAGSPDNAAVAGKIVGGTFTGGPGDISLQIALGGTAGIQLDLIGARAKATGISENGMESIIIGGALTKEDLDSKVIPAIHLQIAPIITEDCTNTTPPDCGCAAGSTGKTVLNLFDSMPKDCTVTVDEIKNNSLIQSLLAPDVTIGGRMALSIGLKAKAVKGTFPTAP